MCLKMAKWFEWSFGVVLMATITVITSLNFLEGFARGALLVGLLLYLIVSLIVQFDKAGWFDHERR